MGCGLQMGNGRSPDGSQLKSRTTWAGDEMSGTMNQENSAAKKVSRRKTVSQNTGTRDDSPDTGEILHLLPIFVEPTCANARWALIHRFSSVCLVVCYLTKIK